MQPNSNETRANWEARLRQSPSYEHAVALLAEIELVERKLEALRRSPALKSDAGQLASLDRMEAKLRRMENP